MSLPPNALRTELPADWSIYKNREAWPLSGGRVFLGEAVRQLGHLIYPEWSGEEPSWANNSRRPIFPYEDDAFDESGAVVPVHAAFANVVRDILSPGEFESELLTRGDRAKLMASYVTDPSTGTAITGPLLRAKNGEDRDDPITFGHWAEVWWTCHLENDELDGAEQRLRGVASLLVDLAQTGVLKTSARPLRGGAAIELAAELWEVDSGLPRMASCGINLDDPLNPDAPITHWIFADGADLARKMGDDGKQATVLASTEADIKKVAGFSQATIDECVRWLTVKFNDPATELLTKEDFAEQAIAIHGSRLSHRGFVEAWRVAARDFPTRSRAGRRPSR